MQNVYSALLSAWPLATTSDANLYGVEVAIVTNVQDPEKQGRVKVCFPRLPGKPESDWARVCQPAAGAGRGFYWLPEVSDEVLVAFERGQANHPYVLRALWNGKDKPMQAAVTDDNSTRMIQTKSGHVIAFSDKDGEEKITIADKSAKRALIFDAKNKKLVIQADEGDVQITAKKKLKLECADLEIKTKKTAKVRIGSEFKLKVAGKAAFKAGPRLELKADQVNLNPPSLTLEGIAEAVVEAVEGLIAGATKGASPGAAESASAGAEAGSTVPTRDGVEAKGSPAAGADEGGKAEDGAGKQGKEEQPAPASGDVLVILRDDSGNPASGVAWEVTLPDGTKHTGTTAGDGKVAVAGGAQSGQYKLVLPAFEKSGQQPPAAQAPPQDAPAEPPSQEEPEEPPAQSQPGDAPAPEPQGALKSLLFASPALKEWIADASAAPIKKGDSRKMLVRAARLGIFALQKAGNVPYGLSKSPNNAFDAKLETAVKKFQQDHAGDDLSVIGQEAGSLEATGQMDPVTARLVDHLLQQDQPKTAGMPYKPVTVSKSEIPANGPGELARRCMEVLRYWASEHIPYSPEGTDHPFVHPVGFGNAWFLGTRTATCSPSTAAALFWACGGMLNGKHFAHDDLFYTAYSQWQIFQHRQDFPDAAAGAVETLQIGSRIELTGDEAQAAGTDATAILHCKVNKLREGDLVQGWRAAYTPPPDGATKPPEGWKKKEHNASEPGYAAYVKYLDWQLKMDGGHSFFITSVDAKDASGNVPGFTILTANSEGVSEKHVPWNRWKDIRIARFFKIDGE